MLRGDGCHRHGHARELPAALCAGDARAGGWPAVPLLPARGGGDTGTQPAVPAADVGHGGAAKLFFARPAAGAVLYEGRRHPAGAVAPPALGGRAEHQAADRHAETLRVRLWLNYGSARLVRYAAKPLTTGIPYHY